jgi:hypothetical protein
MSELHVRQIKATLDKFFTNIIDLSDVSSKAESEVRNHFLTRSLAAFVLMYLANIKPQEAAVSVVDGSKDNGIDAIYYQPPERVLYIVQSKWRHDGTGSVDRGEMQKFLKGFKDLVNARWERFNEKVSKRAAEIESALNDASTRIILVVAYTGQEPLSAEVKQDLKDAVDEINDTAELVSSQVLRQVNIYSAVAQGTEGAPIDVEIALYDWGQVREPYGAFYGQVSASDVAGWFSDHQNRLFAPNIRMFLGSTTDVNSTIVNTLLSAPQDFWYFNNGITALCRTIKKKPIGGNTRETGLFECHDLRIVNGAQTVGAIASAAARDSSQTAGARVAVRLISLDQCPVDFDKQVTRYNNTQNRIDRRDFVALDVEQERIRGELQLDGVVYVYKSGESFSGSQNGFDLVEATVARACNQKDVALAVQAKREIGKLWDDIEKAPYKVLFNPSVSGPTLWRAVQVVRTVEGALAMQRARVEGRARLLAVHGNRFIAHLVFNCLPASILDDRQTFSEKTIRMLVRSILASVLVLLDHQYPDAYLASLFKNATKCQHLKAAFRCPPAAK